MNIIIYIYLQIFSLMLSGVFPNLEQNTNLIKQTVSISKKKKTFYVIGHEWHTGIVIQTSDIPDSLKSKHPQFPKARFLEIGWGDKEFYQDSDPGYFLAIKAALWPTESALHINGFNQPVDKYYSLAEVVQFETEKPDFENLYLFIYSAFARDSLGGEILIGRGYYKNSQFFLGDEKYYLPKTCNVWTAQAVHSAGISISPYRYQKAESLMKYLKKVGSIKNPDS